MSFKRFKRYINWKLVSIILFTGVLGLISLPTEYQPSFTPQAIKDMKVNLGLDLQGGSQLEYNVDLSKVEDNSAKRNQIVEGVKEVINKRVNSLGVSEPNIYISNLGDETHIIVELAGIKDLEEAKNTVGKTIQLEFKEQNTEQDPNLKETRKTEAQEFLNELLAKSDQFEILAEQKQKSAPERIQFDTTELLFKDEIAGTNIQNAIFAEDLEVGSIVPVLTEDTAGLTLTTSGQIINSEGFFILKLVEKNLEAERIQNNPKEVSASHILISYTDAERSTVNRSKEEAKSLAEEVLEKAKATPESFEELAKEYTDEEAGKTSGGKLDTPVKEGGAYVPEFTTAALKLNEAGEITPLLVETEFGYHIIKANEVVEASETTTTEPQVKFAKVLFSTAPDEWKATALTGEYFVNAEMTFDQMYRPQVAIKFNAEGARLFEELTEKNIGKRIAIFVGGELISAPNVSEKIAGGQAVINGDFDPREAKELARDLNTGAIPAPITLIGQYSIGASLGQEALSSSLKAGILGLIVLAIYMIAYYRLPGLIANFALGIYSILLIFLIKSSLPISYALLFSFIAFAIVTVKIIQNKQELFLEKLISFAVACCGLYFFTFILSSPVVLTLAGIAGVILSIGMAVDANVLIFERIKEELRAGKEYSKAVDIGFNRAWSSIRDSNYSSLITCTILYFFGTSIIRGFALNLAAGILISMFTAITVTRAVMKSLEKTKIVNNEFLLHLTSEKKEKQPYKILEKTKIWVGSSAVIIVISIISFFAFGFNQGLDFKGGTLMNIDFKTETSTEAIHAVIEEITGTTDSVIIPSGSENTYQITTTYLENETHDLLIAKFKENISKDLEETRYTTIGAKVSQNLKHKAIIAIIISLIAIILYIASAFRHNPKELSAWKFGSAAVLGLAHNVIITVGVFSLFQLEIDALFITALLTIIGFSVHDTIVVFDRIRENLKNYTKQTNFSSVCNIALTQTMTRSINTSISTLLPLVALFFWGSASISNFVLALIIGVVVGTYASIFIATPILALMINISKK